MSFSQTGTLLAPTTVTVAPTETTLASFTRDDLKRTKRVTVQIDGHATQMLTVAIYRRQTGMTRFALSDTGLLTPVLAGESRMADLDVYGTDELEIRGYLDGAGGDVQIGVVRAAELP